MNQKKFYERVKLFNEIIYEINKVETNYSLELNKLSKRLDSMIEEHKQAINLKLSTEISPKKTINKSKSIKPVLNNKEENPMIDKLISEGLQNLLNFYKNKNKLISTQVSKLGVILYQFSSTQKKYVPEDLTLMEKCAKDFEENFLKFMKVKKLYFVKMCELELFLHKSEKDNKLISKFTNQKIKKDDNNNINNENLLGKENIEELIKIRQRLMKIIFYLIY